MNKISILHLVTAAKNASPFDVNMAFDAGYEKIMPYTNVLLNEVVALTQDAIFSRSPSGIKQEAFFFGGRDIHLALDMQKAARSAMFKPFEMSTFSDPSGAFTTAAAMLAKVDAHLQKSQQTLGQQTIAIFGASGTVGSTAALIAARQGAKIMMMAHADTASMQAYVDNMQQRYDVQLTVADGSSDAAKKNSVGASQCCFVRNTGRCTCVRPRSFRKIFQLESSGRRKRSAAFCDRRCGCDGEWRCDCRYCDCWLRRLSHWSA